MKIQTGRLIAKLLASLLFCVLVTVGRAQTIQASSTNFQAEVQELEQTGVTPASEVTTGGTYYSAKLVNEAGPAGLVPYPTSMNQSAWNLGDNVWLLDDLRTSSSAATRSGMLALDDSEPPSFSDTNDDGGDYTYTNLLSLPPLNTNILYLLVNSVTNGQADLSLGRATNEVYSIWGTSNLLTPFTNWQVFTEVWPTNGTTNLLSFTVDTYDNTNLFWRAEDWTGVYLNGLPEWWTWLYYGNLSETAGMLDSGGVNTLGYDFTNNLDPNVIYFSLVVTNNYVNTMNAPVQLNITSGSPGYFVVSVDDTNYANDADWQAYTGNNLTANLGSSTGWHDVWVGLKGPAANATVTWQWEHLNLTVPPVLAITNPVTGVVDEPMIQIYGYCQESLASINYDISNAVGVVTNQQSEITDRYYDTNICGFTTNYFECLDVPLTNGLNTITIHATDLAGDTTTTNFNFTLDYSSKTNPPMMQITWPQNGTQISGSNITIRGTIADPTAAVTTQVVFTNSNTNLFFGGIYTNPYAALVERNGNFWLENLPLNAGTNTFTITTTDVVGNTSVTNISVVQSALVLTINPVTPDSQLWQPTVSLTGNISDATYAVWVNGVKGTNNANGTWSASNVPVNSGGTASFTATAYGPTEQQPDGSYGN